MSHSGRTRLAIFATHPIQYQVPWFRALHACGELDLTVHYARLPDPVSQGAGFGVPFRWDIPLLEGYRWTVGGALPGGAGARRLSLREAVRAADVVLVTGWQEQFLRKAALTALVAGLPVLVRGESNVLRRRAWPTRVLHRAYLRLFDYFLVIGRANDGFYEQYGVPAARRVRCPYFVENERFAADASRLAPCRAALRSRWAVPADAFCFLFAGKLVEQKRPLDLLQALARVRRQGVSVHLLVVGDGVLRPALEALAREADLPVTVAGFLNQTQITSAYVAADALVLPSDYGETWGLVVNEAMACERPAVVSDRVGCAADLVTDGQTGYVFPFADVGALADRMCRLAADPEHAKEMGRAACCGVRDSYSVGAAVNGTLAAVRAAMRR